MAFENHSAASAYLGGLALNSSKAFCLHALNSALTASPDAASFGASSVRGGGGASASSSSSLSFFCWRAHQTSAAMPTPAAAATARACVVARERPRVASRGTRRARIRSMFACRRAAFESVGRARLVSYTVGAPLSLASASLARCRSDAHGSGNDARRPASLALSRGPWRRRRRGRASRQTSPGTSRAFLRPRFVSRVCFEQNRADC